MLTESTYYLPDANKKYMSNSLYNMFLDCEAAAIAYIAGEYEKPKTPEMLVGSYLHAWNEQALDKFKSDHPEMFKKNGEPYSQFVFADQMIETLESDPFVMMMLEGEHEVIKTADMFGTPWKIKIDTLSDSIVDLKTTRSIRELTWNAEYAQKCSFIENYNIIRQLAIYAEVERIASDRDTWLPTYVVAVSKESPPDKAIIDVYDPSRFEAELLAIAYNMPRILAVRDLMEKPKRCEKCAYCRSTKRISDIISYRDLEGF